MTARVRAVAPPRVLLVPAAFAVAFVLLMVDSTGVSPYAALRVLVLVPALMCLVAVVLWRLLADADAAAVITSVLLFTAPAMRHPAALGLLAVVLALLVAVAVLARTRRASTRRAATRPRLGPISGPRTSWP